MRFDDQLSPQKKPDHQHNHASADSAESLSRLSHLAAILFRDGATESNLKVVDQLPSVQSLVDDSDEVSDRSTSSQFALVDRDVFLRQSAYVDRTVRSDLDRALRLNYSRVGLTEFDHPVDHVSVQLTYLSVLLKRSPEIAERFASEYLMMWLPPLFDAIHRTEDKVDVSAVELVVELARELISVNLDTLDDRVELDGERRLTIRSLAIQLSSPELCGVFIHRDDLVRIARKHDMPIGFGSRRNMIETLVDSSVRYQKLPEVVDNISVLMDRALKRYAELCRRIGLDASDNTWIRITRTMQRHLRTVELTESVS